MLTPSPAFTNCATTQARCSIPAPPRCRARRACCGAHSHCRAAIAVKARTDRQLLLLARSGEHAIAFAKLRRNSLATLRHSRRSICCTGGACVPCWVAISTAPRIPHRAAWQTVRQRIGRRHYFCSWCIARDGGQTLSTASRQQANCRSWRDPLFNGRSSPVGCAS